METLRKNSATICVLNASGASLVDSDCPTGESSSSAMVNRNRIPTMPSSGVATLPTKNKNTR